MTSMFPESSEVPHAGAAPKDLAGPGLPLKSTFARQSLPLLQKYLRTPTMLARQALLRRSEQRNCLRGSAPAARHSEDAQSGTPLIGEAIQRVERLSKSVLTAAVKRGRKGGTKTAERGPEYFRQICCLGALEEAKPDGFEFVL